MMACHHLHHVIDSRASESDNALSCTWGETYERDKIQTLEDLNFKRRAGTFKAGGSEPRCRDGSPKIQAISDKNSLILGSVFFLTHCTFLGDL